MFSDSGIDLDYFNISFNTLAYLGNGGRKMKIFKMTSNVYPRDAEWGNFWQSRIYDTYSPINAGVTFPAMMLNFSIIEELDLSGSELDDETTDYDSIIAEIMTDKGVTEAVAKTIFKYNPKYSDNAPHDPYNPTSLPRGGL